MIQPTQSAAPCSQTPAHPVTTPPVVCCPTPDGFQVMWGVSCLAKGWVEVRVHDESSCRVWRNDGRGFVPHGDEFIRVRVSGLPAGSTVQMRTVTEAMDGSDARHVSPWEDVHLLNNDASELHFAV